MMKPTHPSCAMTACVLVLVVVALTALAGCSSVHVLSRPDGTFEVSSNTLLLNRGIDEARFGKAYIKGYGSNTANEAIKAVAEGVTAGAMKAAAAPVVP